MPSIFSEITLPEQLTLGYAIGRAAGEALTPFIQDLINQAWATNPARPLDALLAAGVVAEGFADQGAMAAEASYTGYDSDRFAYMYDLALTAPGEGELLEMLRRGTISASDFTHGLRKARREPMWNEPLSELQTVRLTPEQLALGIVRSVVPDPGLLVVTLDTDGSTIPAYPQWPGDVLAEAAAGGIDKDRLRTMVGEVGLPMSLQQAASATFRGIINRQAYNLAVLEGDTRPEYADAIFEQARLIPSAHEAVQYELRGFTDDSGRYKLTDLHGMSHAHSDVLYDIAGRAPSVHEIVIGLARGATYPSTYEDVPEPYRSAIQRSDIRPEFADIVYHARFSYPSAFVIRSLATSGEWGEQTTKQTLLELGWKPELVDSTLQAWYGTASAGGDKHVARAQTQLWNTTHASYRGQEISDTEATSALTAAGVTATAIPSILSVWQTERDLVRKSLSAAQIAKAVKDGVVNPSTGAVWTTQDATARLLELGYDPQDAQTLLEL